jgi:CDP-diacylglycerol--glycerol-3-phosphate 3-phosphatidyltransferase
MAATILRLIPKFVTPNQVTIFRLITTPIVALLMFYGQYQVGFWAFIIVAFTDAIDGSLARTRDQITEWGKVYDPIADKVLISAMVFIIVLRYIDLWASLIIISLEIIIVIVGWYRLRKGRKVQANIWGKIKMILQVVGVAILLFSVIFNWAELLPWASGTLYIAIAFAIVSLLTYGI